MSDEDRKLLTRADVYQRTLRRFFAPVADVLYDPEHDDINEIMINGPNEIYIERAGGELEKLEGVSFESEAHLQAAVNNLAEYVQRRLGQGRHSMDARLPEPERFRVHVIIPPASRDRIVVTIRKFARVRITLEKLLRWQTLSEPAAQFLNVAIRLKRNLLVSGGTGTGKTSLLNALSASINDTERVIVIEDSSELNLKQPHAIYLESVPPGPDGKGGASIRDLFVDSLRMRPDRILVGEVRRGEALDLVQSMLSGHDGAMSTVHASSPTLALVRLETLCLMSDVNMPDYVARTQVASAIQLVVQIIRTQGRRLVSRISEVRGLRDGRRYELTDLFRRAAFRSGARNVPPLEETGAACSFAADARAEGLTMDAPLCRAVFQENEDQK